MYVPDYNYYVKQKLGWFCGDAYVSHSQNPGLIPMGGVRFFSRISQHGHRTPYRIKYNSIINNGGNFQRKEDHITAIAVNI